MAARLLEQIDARLASLLGDWSVITTGLALLLCTLVAYPIIIQNEPDTHPLLLARQSQPAPVRNKNESAVYRSPETPYSYPLKSGLNVKDAGAPRWQQGKDGDLRDVWREVQKAEGGDLGEDGKEVPKGKIMTIMGKEEVIEHGIGEMSREIAVVGQCLKAAGVKKVALYLPNSVEYLETVFACAFYGLTPILLPYNQPHPKVFELLKTTGADALISAAGNLPLEDLAKECQNLRLLIWVVEPTSRHMDWNGTPAFAQDRLKVSVWHDIIQSAPSSTSSLPSNSEGEAPAELITVTQPTSPSQKPEIATFTHRNLVAATAALLSALPLRQRFSPSDLVLPSSSFNDTYVLCQTFAALFTHASLAINSVASPGVDLALAARGVSPTVIIVSTETMIALHAKENAQVTSPLHSMGMYLKKQALEAGRMPTPNLLSNLLGPATSSAGNEPGQLRLILISHRLSSDAPLLTSSQLSDLRIFTGARIVYALVASQVAGAVCQTNVFDYRVLEGGSHFGLPSSSVEIKLVGSEDEVGQREPVGEMVVSGPAVSGQEGKVKLGVRGFVSVDGTIAPA